MNWVMRMLARLPWAGRLRDDARRAATLQRAAEVRLEREQTLATERIRMADAVIRQGRENGFSLAMEMLYSKGNNRWRT